jgi:hypothetical protein
MRAERRRPPDKGEGPRAIAGRLCPEEDRGTAYRSAAGDLATATSTRLSIEEAVRIRCRSPTYHHASRSSKEFHVTR